MQLWACFVSGIFCWFRKFVNFPQSWSHWDLLSRNILVLVMRMFRPQRWYHPICNQQMVWLIDQDRDSHHLGKLSTILQHFTHTQWNPVTHCYLPMSLCGAGCILRAKLIPLDTLPSSGSSRVTILLAIPVQMLVHCIVKHSRPPDLKSSSNISLPFAWITGPATDLSF